MPIQNFDIVDFLANYWQQKPLLIRNAFPDFVNPLEPEDLAGLACEPEIESRLITDTDGEWNVSHGPIAEETFNTLADSHWTLLVQAVDHWVPEVTALLDSFIFIPSWRIDDIMVSYATRGGSVGPHFDNYDVFLLQGAGKRRWQVGGQYSSSSTLQNNPELHLLADFTCEQEWVLEAGDMLYIPPRFGHWGTAIDNDCMTYSIGFRAPSHREILSGFCDETLDSLSEELRYSDPGLLPQENGGEIAHQAIDAVQSILQHYVNDKQRVAQWFGRYMTQQKYASETSNDGDSQLNQNDLAQLLGEQSSIHRDPASRFSFIESNGPELPFSLFVNGVCFDGHGSDFRTLSRALTTNGRLPVTSVMSLLKDPECLQLLLTLVNQGSLYFEDEIDS